MSKRVGVSIFGVISLVIVVAPSVASAEPIIESPACKPTWFRAKHIASLIASYAPRPWFERVRVHVPRCEDRESVELVVSSSTAAVRRSVSVADAPRAHRARTLALVIASIEAPPIEAPRRANEAPRAEERSPDAPRSGDRSPRSADRLDGADTPTAGRVLDAPSERDGGAPLERGALAARSATTFDGRTRDADAPNDGVASGAPGVPTTLAAAPRDDAPAITTDPDRRALLPRDEDPLVAHATPDAPRVHAIAIDATAETYPEKRGLLFGGTLAYAHRLDDSLRLTAGVAARFGRARVDLGEVEISTITARLGAGLCPVEGAFSVCGYATAEVGLGTVAGVGSDRTSTGRAFFLALGFDLVAAYALTHAYALTAGVGVRPTVRGIEGGSADERVGIGGLGVAAGLGVTRTF